MLLGTFRRSLLFVMFVVPLSGIAEPIQVTLESDKESYEIGEPVSLSYDVLWLGKDDVTLYINALSFPVLRISYLNLYPLALTDSIHVEIRTNPGRHEIHTLAPTMHVSSSDFIINSSSKPVRYLDGISGRYILEKPGYYVLRAFFPVTSSWSFYHGQESDIYSNYLVINIETPE